MRTLSTDLKNHLAQECTTIATCWEVKRKDGKKFFFTDHDADIVYINNIYSSSQGYNRTAVSGSSNYDTDEMNLTGFFSSSSIIELEVRNGLFDFSEVLIFIVNFNDLTQGRMILKKGFIGEIIIAPNGIFNCEFRGMTQSLSQNILDRYQAECRADLGDSKCKIPVDPDLVLRDESYSVGDFVKVQTGNPSKLRWALTILDWDFATLAGWTVGYGFVRITPSNGGLTPYSGVNFLEGQFSASEDFQVYQDIDLTADVNFDSVACDAEEIVMDATVALASSVLDERDSPQFRIEALDSSGIIISEVWTLEYDVILPNNTWRLERVSDVPLPIGTRTLRILCEGKYRTGVIVNADFDAIKINLTDTNGASGFYEMYEDKIYECSTAGTTASVQPTYITTVGNTTTDGTAVLKCYESWTRYGVVAGVVDNQIFTITMTDARAVDATFDNGLVYFESGNNTGMSMDVKYWHRTLSDQVTLFIPMPNDVQIGDRLTIQWGCNKTLSTCKIKYAMSGSTNFSSGNHFNFRGEPFLPGRDEILRFPDAK